jgi:two-component system sensor histidine kinase HydH
MTETIFAELRRYVRFDAADETTLRAFEPVAARHFEQIVEKFYGRVAKHDEAARVVTDSDQTARHKHALRDWLQGLFAGPWDEQYYERRLRIGRVLMQIGLPQRFMFGAMNVIRTALAQVAERERPEPQRRAVRRALDKLLDIELAIMLESQREAYIEQIQREERLARIDLQRRLDAERQLGIRTRRSERLAALGTMAAGFAHEIRNPLNAAHLQLSVAERRLQGPDIDLEASKAAMRVAAREMERLGALVIDFLQFARPQALHLERIDLRRTLESSLGRLVPEAESRGVKLQLQLGEAVTIEADDEKLKQVVLNLVRNAIDAAGSGGWVELSTATSGPYAEVVVRDNGPGIGNDLPIFEPFFTTKEAGTGLGLAIVHRIVMDHAGQVAVQSVPGDTRFTVSLPRTHGG